MIGHCGFFLLLFFFCESESESESGCECECARVCVMNAMGVKIVHPSSVMDA